MTGRMLSVRPFPLKDELLSSWFVRLAHSNGDKVQNLAFRAFGRAQRFVNMGDMDRGGRLRVESILSSITGVSLERVQATTLAAYQGWLWAEASAYGVRRWVMPVVDRRHRRSGHSLQACTECLKEPVPYFRRSWRLALHVVCPFHGIRLIDRCPGCGEPLAIHRGDVGTFTPEADSSVRWCARCKADLAEDFGKTQWEEDAVVDFQWLVLETLSRGWINIDGRVVHSTLFFDGLWMLWNFLDAPAWSGRMRATLEREGIDLPSPSENRYGGVNVRSLHARHQLLNAAGWLLEEWPDRFLHIASQAGISGNRLLHFCVDGAKRTPFWLWAPVHAALDRTMYVPTDEEIEQAVKYLRRTLGHVRVRDACQMLNMATNSSKRVAAVVRTQYSAIR